MGMSVFETLRSFGVMKINIVIASLFLICSCAGVDSSEDDVERKLLKSSLSPAEIKIAKHEVRSLMISYQEAMDNFDSETLLGHVSDSPEFVYTRASKRSGYTDFEKGTRDLSKYFKKIENSFDTIYVDLITPIVAVAALEFEETLINMIDEQRDISGSISWIAVKTDGVWQFVHGHSFKEI